MNRITNLWNLVVRALTNVVALIKWLSDDKTTEEINRSFDLAEKISIRVVQFYRDNSEAMVDGAKALNRTINALERAKEDLAEDLEAVAEKLKTSTSTYEADVKEMINREVSSEKREEAPSKTKKGKKGNKK